MSGSSESWQRGRDFEEQMSIILQNYFQEIKPIFKKKTPKKRNFDFIAQENGKEITIECKSCFDAEYSTGIHLQDKDFLADYLFMKSGKKVFIFKKYGEFDLCENK
jgi:hypothetical protein